MWIDGRRKRKYAPDAVVDTAIIAESTSVVGGFVVKCLVCGDGGWVLAEVVLDCLLLVGC